MDTKNYAQVLIDGKIYTLTGSEGEAYLQKTASYVNEKLTAMRRLPGFGKQNSDYQMAMLGLNVADDYFKAREEADRAVSERDAMEKETYSLKHELVGTQMKLEAVLKEAVASGTAWVVDCAIDKDAMVHPMVSGGAPVSNFLLD